MNKILLLIYIIVFYVIGVITVWIVNSVLEFDFDLNFVLITPITPAIIGGVCSFFIIKKLL